MSRFIILIIFLNLQVYSKNYYVVPNNPNLLRNGESWETAWSGFTDFNINSLPDEEINIYVRAGEYSQSNYIYENDNLPPWKVMLLITTNKIINILPEFEYSNIILNGINFNGDTYDTTHIGIMINNPNEVVPRNIKIEGLTFKNFKLNGIRVRGYHKYIQDYFLVYPIKNVNILNCRIENCLGSYEQPNLNCAAINISLAESINIEKCTINQYVENTYGYQSEGIYIEGCYDTKIKENYISLSHNNVKVVEPHIDGVQITYATLKKEDFTEIKYSNLVLIEKNKIFNHGKSNIDSNKNRQGIYLEAVEGDANIINNIVQSKAGAGLIGVYLKPTNGKINIQHNTLHSIENPTNVIYIRNNSLTGFISSVNINNNIIYKPYTGSKKNYAVIYLDELNVNEKGLIPKVVNIPNNIFYCGIDAVPQIQLNFFNAPSEKLTSINMNPQFIDPSLANYNLLYTSPAKNGGIGLLSNKVTTDLLGNSRPYWNKDFDIGAFEIEDAQLKIGIFSPDGSEILQPITHTLSVLGTYWEKDSNLWVKSIDQNLKTRSFTNEAKTQTIKLDDFIVESFKGWQYKWLNRSNTIPNIGAGFYKLTNDHIPGNFIYLDLRESPYNYSSNAYLVYTPITESYSYYIKGVGESEKILNGTVIKLSTMANNLVPNISNLQDYWRSSFIVIKRHTQYIPGEYYYFPLQLWNKYSGAYYYKIEKKTEVGNWVYLTNVSSSQACEYLDLSKVYADTTNNPDVQYRVTAYNGDDIPLSTTYPYTIGMPRIEPRKEVSENTAALKHYNYSLHQNFPNPFNPLTDIKFSIQEKGLTILKVYNIMGEEITVLLNDELDKGEYSVKLDASSLPTGIYFYHIQSGRFNQVKKMILLK